MQTLRRASGSAATPIVFQRACRLLMADLWHIVLVMDDVAGLRIFRGIGPRPGRCQHPDGYDAYQNARLLTRIRALHADQDGLLDLYSGLVVGWSMSPHQDRQLVVQAVRMALWQRSDRTSVILHSDRGGQSTSEAYQCFLAAHHITGGYECRGELCGQCRR